MRKPSKLLLFALGLTSTIGISSAFAQQDPSGDGTWSLTEAITYASKNNLRAQQSLVNRDLDAVDLRQSRFNRLPSINAGGGYNYNTGSYQDPVTFSLVNQSSQTASAQVSANMPLFMGFQQVNTIKQNELDLMASEQNALAVQNDITIQIVTSYLNILFSEELIKTSSLQRDLTQQQLGRNRILFKAGSVAENSVLELESQLASDELSIINAQNQRDLAQVSLMQLLNIPISQTFKIEIPEIPEPDQKPVLVNGQEVFDIASQTQPAIKAADLRVLSAGKGLEIARGAYYPRLSLVGGVSSRYSNNSRLLLGRDIIDNGFLRQDLYKDSRGTTFDRSVYLPSLEFRSVYADSYSILDQFNDNISSQAGIQLSIPILNSLQARSNVQRAKINEYNARLNADIARNTLRQTIEQAYVDALAAQRKYIAAREQLRAAEKNYKNAELRLNSGVINTVDFNLIANNFRAAQSNLLQAKYEFTFKQKVLDFYQGKDISF
jgi:outer membrane protein